MLKIEMKRQIQTALGPNYCLENSDNGTILYICKKYRFCPYWLFNKEVGYYSLNNNLFRMKDEATARLLNNYFPNLPVILE